MIPYIKGKITKQAHVDIPEGCVEEEMGREGFFGRYAHLFRSEPPTNWTRIEGPLRPHAYDFNKVSGIMESPKNRLTYFENRDLKISFFSITSEMNSFFRNADGDDLYFVHRGRGEVETDFGPLSYEEGDYLLIPRGTVVRFLPRTATMTLLIESSSEFKFPEKGLLGHHALFDPAVLTVPEPSTPPSRIAKASEYRLDIQRVGEITSVYYPNPPINALGWKGTLSPWKLNVREIRPISCERYHLPPSAHTTLVAKNFVICSFLPRPLETGDPGALRVPFYHSNIDYDEVIFYHSGEFFSRSTISEGMLTFHPQGIHHGPHPNAVERSHSVERTNEIAVMIDTRYPLHPTQIASKIEIQDYWNSWK